MHLANYVFQKRKKLNLALSVWRRKKGGKDEEGIGGIAMVHPRRPDVKQTCFCSNIRREPCFSGKIWSSSGSSDTGHN